MTAVEELSFAVPAWLFSERRVAVPILLSSAPVDDRTIFGRIDEHAEGFGAGYFVVGPHYVEQDEGGWSGETLLRPVDGSQRVEDVRVEPQNLLFHLGGHAIGSRPTPQTAPTPPSERDANPFRLWALDEQHRAFVVFTGNDDTLYAPSRYGTAIHPGRYRALDSLPETGEATPVRLRSVAASDDETPQTWVLGSRAAIARHSPVDLPPVIVPDWIVALRPAEGGEPIPVMVGLGGDVITVDPAATPPPDWPTDSRLHLEAASELELDHLVGQTVTLIATPYRALSPGRLFRRKGTALGQYVVEAAEPPA